MEEKKKNTKQEINKEKKKMEHGLKKQKNTFNNNAVKKTIKQKSSLIYGLSGLAVGTLTIAAIAAPVAVSNNKNKEISALMTNFNSKTAVKLNKIKELKQENKELKQENQKKLDKVNEELMTLEKSTNTRNDKNTKKIKELENKKTDLERELNETLKELNKNIETGQQIVIGINLERLNPEFTKKYISALNSNAPTTYYGTWKTVVRNGEKNASLSATIEQEWNKTLEQMKQTSQFERQEEIEMLYARDLKNTLFYNFKDNTKTRAIVMPKLETIQDYAFYNNSSLSYFYAPNVKIINSNGLAYTSLKELTFHNLERVGSNAFEGSDNLKKLVLDKVAHVESESFSGLKNLNYISLKSLVDVKEMKKGKNLFDRTSLSKLTVVLSRTLKSNPELNKIKDVWFGKGNWSKVKFEFK